jgi:hypothetical protein
MKALIIALLAVWLVLAVLGAVLEGLLWLLFIAVLALVATATWGWLRLRSRS